MTGLRRGDIRRSTLADIETDGIHVKPHRTAHRSGKKLIIEWDAEGEPSSYHQHHISRVRRCSSRVRENLLLRLTVKRAASTPLWQRFMRKLVEETNVTRFQARDLRSLIAIASESGSLQEASERLAHSDTEITARVYRRKPTKVNCLIR
jgi:integrase